MRELSNSARKLRNRIILLPCACLFVVSLSNITHLSDLAQVQASGKLVMLTLPGPTTYFEDGHGENGFDYLLAKAFADSLNVELVVQTKPTLRALLFSVGGPQGDFAAANLVQTDLRNKSLRFTRPYLEVTQQLIYRTGNKRPRSLSQLEGDLVVVADSSHSEQLQKLAHDFPSLSWREHEDLEMGELIKKVHEGEIAYTVVDSLAYLINRHIYPQARRALDISEPQPIAWAFPSHYDGTLLAAANQFLQDYRDSGQLALLTQQLFAQTENFSAADSHHIGKLVQTRLPVYESLLRETAATLGLDWHLLAAVAYQESHWYAKAKSPTGVRGLMMLTLDTAREMNVSNRLDAAQSLRGGAAYLLKLKSRLPQRIVDPDRTLLALAAYNVGFGHLEDARVLTARAGKNPDLWTDVRQYLPMLSKKKYYSTVKHGYARGKEPVLYVDNIQYYRSYLQLYTLTQQDFTPMAKKPDQSLDWEANALPSL